MESVQPIKLVQVPRHMKGNESIDDYCLYFDQLVRLNGLSDGDAAAVFATNIPTDLLRVVQTNLTSYAEMKQCLLNVNDPTRDLTVLQLFAISSKTEPSFDKLRAQIESLVDKIYSKAPESIKQLLYRDFFLNALPTDAQTFLIQSQAADYQQLLSNAKLFEMSQIRLNALSLGGDSNTSNNNNRSSKPNESSKQSTTVVCHKCGRKGHIAAHCRTNVQSSNSQNTVNVVVSEMKNIGVAQAVPRSKPDIKCQTCGRKGHIATHCRTKPEAGTNKTVINNTTTTTTKTASVKHQTKHQQIKKN